MEFIEKHDNEDNRIFLVALNSTELENMRRIAREAYERVKESDAGNYQVNAVSEVCYRIDNASEIKR